MSALLSSSICVREVSSSFTDGPIAGSHQKSLEQETFDMSGETAPEQWPYDSHWQWDAPIYIVDHIKQDRGRHWSGLDRAKVLPIAYHLAWQSSVLRKLRQQPLRSRRRRRPAVNSLPTQSDCTGTASEGHKLNGA
jgi:hypothetical protein